MFDGALNYAGESISSGFEPTPRRVRLSHPAPGRSLGATVTRVARPVREAVGVLSRAVAIDKQILESVFGCTVYGPGFFREPDDLRLSWFLVTTSLTHALLTRQSKVGPFFPALEWFFGDARFAKRVLACFPQHQVKAAEDQLKALDTTEELHDLLPYVIEPHGHITRNSLETCDKAKQTRDVKKNAGVYYTPSDVAEFMAKSLSNISGGQGTWIDPACGTGVFLRAAIAESRNSESGVPEGDLPKFVFSSVFGIDKSALATDLATFIVLLECSRNAPASGQPFQLWQQIKRNIACMDALRLAPHQDSLGQCSDLSQRVEVQHIFPRAGSEGFDHVIMNPPYATTRIDEVLKFGWHSYSEIAVGQSVDTHLAFTEMLWRLTSITGVSAAVLPLSIGTNTTRSYLRLRQELLQSSGAKDFLFFDREPQALFGEDIKTRNLIIFRKGSQSVSECRTSRLLKWTAEQRKSIFTRDRLVKIDVSQCRAFVPKLGTTAEMQAYCRVQSPDVLELSTKFAPRCGRMSLDEAIARHDTAHRFTLLVSSTAYNFINCYFSNALPTPPPRPYSSSPINALQYDLEEDAFAAFAIVSSRLCFWLWHVEGDGFHLTNDFLKRLPLWAALRSKQVKQQLAEHGRHLWRAAMGGMVGAVNGGKQTYSFHCGYDHPTAIDVERKLVRFLELDGGFCDSLDAFIEATVSIDGKQRLRRTDSNLRKIV